MPEASRVLLQLSVGLFQQFLQLRRGPPCVHAVRIGWQAAQLPDALLQVGLALLQRHVPRRHPLLCGRLALCSSR